MIVKLKKSNQEIQTPKYAHGPHEDAGMDLYSSEEVVLLPNKPTLVKTGLSVELPPGYEAQIRSRSGLALKNGICVYNAPGTIDPSYRGEIGVILLWNGWFGDSVLRDGGFLIEKGTKIAQMVVSRYEPISFEVVEEFSDTARGAKGFGSTGTR